MGKKEFLAALRRALRGLSARDIDGHCEFFEEIINDRMEDGLSEAAAVRSLGGVHKVAEQIISQTPLSKIVLTTSTELQKEIPMPFATLWTA